MIQIAIVEDDAAARVRLRECLDYVSAETQIPFDIVEFPSGFSFIGQYQPGFDIVFMDIDMPGMNGMDTARALRKVDTNVVLIFVTNMAQYAISGYEVDALDFILKPVNKYSFAIKVKRAISRTTRLTDQYIQIKTDGGLHRVRITAIQYLETDGHYVIYHTTNGNFAEYGTLKDAESKIGRPQFVRCNRSFLVNLRYVDSICKNSVFVGGAELDISRPQKKAFLSALSDYLGGRMQ
jgi:DNA-binding LytR/AlgR family response regulator